MMSTYLFPEPGCIGTIPGKTFAGVRVDVDEKTGKYTVSPLPQHLAFAPTLAAEHEPGEPQKQQSESIEEQAPSPPAPPVPSLGG